MTDKNEGRWEIEADCRADDLVCVIAANVKDLAKRHGKTGDLTDAEAWKLIRQEAIAFVENRIDEFKQDVRLVDLVD